MWFAKKRMTYKDCLRAAGRKPIPPYRQLRTTKLPGHRELLPVAGVHKYQ